jgi:hypothetical protein
MIEIMKWNEDNGMEIEANKCTCICTCNCTCELLLIAGLAAAAAAVPSFGTSLANRKQGEPQQP